MTKSREPARGAVSLAYRCRLPLSKRALTHVADLLRRHLKAIRSRRRPLPPGKIALIVLAVPRHDPRLAHGRRQQHLRHHRALKGIAKRGSEVVLIDGTLILTQRREPARPNPANTTVTACTSWP
ncbi:hypothetical protein [Streptomyces mirabilis]|uniref:hypothetical protein n=1 Tax=Streptomyces mirabilis TaxID=68239 RepID=UPI003712F3F5